MESTLEREIGRYQLGEDSKINDLASSILGVRPEIFEIVREGEDFIVREVAREEMPLQCRKLNRNPLVSRKGVSLILRSSAELIAKGVSSQYICIMAWKKGKQFYDIYGLDN